MPRPNRDHLAPHLQEAAWPAESPQAGLRRCRELAAPGAGLSRHGVAGIDLGARGGVGPRQRAPG